MVAVKSHLNSYGVEDWNHVLALGHCAHCREREKKREVGRERERWRKWKRGEGGTGKRYYIIYGNMALWTAITYSSRDLARPH